MWMLVILLCHTIAAPSCEVRLYNKTFFEDSVLCLAEGTATQSALAENGIAAAAYCFDVTVIGNNEQVAPNL